MPFASRVAKRAARAWQTMPRVWTRIRIVADLLISGWIEFLAGKSSHYIKAGQICSDEITDAVARES